jgi:hypothetical protein
MTREHSRIERFLGCRIYRALGTTINRYFMLYKLVWPPLRPNAARADAKRNSPTKDKSRIGYVRCWIKQGADLNPIIEFDQVWIRPRWPHHF